MVKKTETIDEPILNKNDTFAQDLKPDSTIIENEAIKNLEILHSKIDLNTIKNLDSGKDVGSKQDKSMLKKIYPVWVYIFKDGVKVKDFGVREETINGIKLLIRTEKLSNETKVIFRELYPEPKYDVSIIEANKKRISIELNNLKQIEKDLEKALFNDEDTKEYNFDLADVRIAILEKEVMLDSIKYGKTFRYFIDLRDDKIPCLFYDFENNGLRLNKKVKESSLFTEASEVKQIESLETKRDIDNQLMKKDDKDWKKIAMAFIGLLLVVISIYGVFKLLDYNQERENGEIIAQLEKTMLTYDRGVAKIVASCNSAYKDNGLITILTEYTRTNQELINLTLSQAENKANGRNIIG